jgi:hypothetical protein
VPADSLSPAARVLVWDRRHAPTDGHRSHTSHNNPGRQSRNQRS